MNQVWTVVSENAKGHGKSRGKPGLTAIAAALAAASLLTPAVYAADAAHATVVGGSGHVSQSGTTTTIQQNSQNLAINWSSLSTAANEALVFNQPNASAIALNRITGSSPSTLLGSLTANGQVYILNPNGVLFGAGAQVNVGGLVASTLGISTAGFMAGKTTFSQETAASGSVVNQGLLATSNGGYVALIGATVRNEGTIRTTLGTTLLAAGNKVTLDLHNGSLLGYRIDEGALNALAENKQLIRADGGQVLLSAKALDSLTTATVNNTGIIEAKTLENRAGRIMLMGDMQHGTVNIGGTLDASAPNGGDGGFIETSAANFKILPGFKVNTLAPQGKTGKWLLDPATITIEGGTGGAANTIYEDTIEAAGADVTIQATDSIFTAGTFAGGDVVVPDGLNLTIQTTAGAGGTGIDLTTSAHGTVLTFKTSGGGNVLMSTGNAAQSLKTSGIIVAGAGTINLNSAGELDVSGSVASAGGAITLQGDSVNIGAPINAGAGKVVVAPTTTNRAITLGGISETTAMNLTDAELDQITASVIAIGSTAHTGGISIGSTGGIINPANTSALSLLNSSVSGPGISQTSAFTATNLNANARTVTLSNSGNQVSQISGRSYAGAFQFRSASALSVGTVDGTAGINSGSFSTLLTTSGALSQTQAIVADSFQGSSTGGMTLNNAGNQIQNFGNINNASSGNIVIRNSVSNTSILGTLSTVGRLDIANTGNISIDSALTAGELTLSTAGTSTQTAAITVTSLELLGSGTHTLNHAGNAVTTLAGNTGSVTYTQAGALTVGTVNTVGLTASGKVLVRTTGAGSDLTLNNAVTSGSAASDSLVLAAGRNFINNAGASPLNPGAGRFLVYSTDPTANTFGGLVSTGNAFSRTLAANAPTDASMTSISGNRMVYSITPTINITGDNQSKAYNAADPILTYTVGSGLVTGDTLGSVLSGNPAAPTGTAATPGTHAITQGTLAAALGYDIAYTNGTLTVGADPNAAPTVSNNTPTGYGSALQTITNTSTMQTNTQGNPQGTHGAFLALGFGQDGRNITPLLRFADCGVNMANGDNCQ